MSSSPEADLPSRLRKEPYLLFFPLGALLSVWAVAPWLLFGLGAKLYPSLFHSVVQIEGFLGAFAAGFLFTFVPRRSKTPPPPAWALYGTALVLVAITTLAWLNQWIASQALWVALVLSAIVEGVRRFRQGGQGLPDGAFVWLPLSLLFGALGALLTAVAPQWAGTVPMLHAVGQALLTQGLFTGLIIGVGRIVVPFMLHGEGLPPSGRFGALRHTLLALLFLLTFLAELFVAGPITWMARALFVAGMCWFSLRLYRLPERPGAHRFLAWLSIWMLPLGYAAMAFFPAWRVAGEHLVFIGGFGLSVLAVSTHVVLSHGGFGQWLQRWPWQLGAVGALMALATALRFVATVDPANLRLWVGGAAAAFLAALVAWALLIVPRLRPPADEG